VLGEVAALRARFDEGEAEGRAPSGGDWRRLGVILDRASDTEHLVVALGEANARMVALVESLPFDFFLLGGDGRYALQNSTCRLHWGELIGTRPGDAAPNPDVCTLWEDNNRRAFAGEVVAGEVVYTHDGDTRHYYNIISPIRDREQVLGVLGINIDITHEKRLADELQRRKQLESLALFAGGIAHDFNNLLTAIQGCVAIAGRQPRAASVPALLARAEQGCVRARGLSERLLTFAKSGDLVLEHTALQPIVEESASLAVSGSKCAVELTVSDELWPVNVDLGQISQVVRNLVSNAVQAMPTGGTINITAANLDPVECTLRGLAYSRWVQLSVEDQGQGIADADMSRLFDPSYTTREDGHGLGLAIVKSVVDKHGGRVCVSRGRERGARFDVFLPAADTSAAGTEV
jgi:PAS domain S-box-containing protein